MTDILYKDNGRVFSYRVGGLIIRDGKVLLQRVVGSEDFAIIGGHVNFGESSKSALIREYKEELGVEVHIHRLLWIGEVFFPWGQSSCHQICFYYLINLEDDKLLPDNESFFALDTIDNKKWKLEFKWVEISQLDRIDLYPTNCKGLLMNLDENIQHFTYRE